MRAPASPRRHREDFRVGNLRDFGRLVPSRRTVRNQHQDPVPTMQGWGMFRQRPA